ncbi:glycosyl transferase [Croceivirga radicis]|uniref:Glycosyl transferase n=1 Tax=Croceivirga radicis TaxID=1929488 RepID=A0A1V6LQD1_9FLAO|nr:glycosyltransferase family 2 protein [Croceivirga radicis]OQD42405.1 glycosyl transferase [Croceivirga radicis]
MNNSDQKITALIITYNEIEHIKMCLDSIRFADEIIVVDSFSTDGTYEYLLEQENVNVIQHPFSNFTAQKSFALEKATNNWVLFIDADEVVTDKLASEIKDTVNKPDALAAYWFYRTFMFKTERLRFSGWQTDKNIRLFQKNKCRFTDAKLVHETLEVDGTTGILKEKLTHYCYKNYADYKGKMLSYGRLKAKEAFYKEKQFNYCLFIFKPFWKFVHHYLIRLGFLDGKKGIIISYLNALSVWERYRELKRLRKKNEIAYLLVMP